jgi:hypothetical protein
MSTHPTFSSLPDATGLDVIDPIETRHFSLFTDTSVTPTDADPERFAFPVSTACRIRCSSLSFPYVIPMEVRTPDGDHRASINLPTNDEFDHDEYLIELHSPVKIYLRVTASMTIHRTEDSVRIEFDGEVPVEVGARSYHSAPVNTITVPDEPEALMEAVSAFPSALKTTSPERAWPTLRGHPPRIERGDELSIPDQFDVPDTGITIAVPPEYGQVYAVAPLAFYLGADVVPGEHAQLTADSGVARFLGNDVEAVGESVEELLKRVFFLDCVVRTEGLYPNELHEREVFESYVDLDFAALYDASPSDRLRTYLSVPDEAVEAIESPWHRVTHVESDPGPAAAELLPYVVNDLSLVKVKTANDEPWTPTEAQRQVGEALEAFVRGPTATADAGRDDGDFLRSANLQRSTRHNEGLEDPDSPRYADDEDSARGIPGEGGYMPLPEADALEQAWIGERTPVEGTKLMLEAFEHDRTTSEDGFIDITVVCNDEEMREELDSAAEIYGDRDDLRVNITSKFGVSTDELRELLAEDSDMFHFIGHIDGLGFQCPDGILNAEIVDEIGATTVLLNGCRSHDQGVALVEAGARAAVVSLADLWNAGAVEVGETLAKLFHYGLSVGHTMEIVREHTSLGRDYVVLGDPGVTLAQCENVLPTIFHIGQCEEKDGDKLNVETHAYPIRGHNIGATFQTYLPESRGYHIGVGISCEIRVTFDSLRRAFNPVTEPLIVNGELTWTDSWFDI